MFRARPSPLSFVSMPTYDYRCPNGHDFEHFYRKISDATTELPCPKCGAVAARRVSGGAGLVFKGSGFYLTDYGKNAHRKSGAEAGSGGSGGDSKSDSSGDGKSAAADSSKTDAAASSSKSESASGATSKSESAKPEPKTAPKPKGGDAT